MKVPSLPAGLLLPQEIIDEGVRRFNEQASLMHRIALYDQNPVFKGFRFSDKFKLVSRNENWEEYYEKCERELIRQALIGRHLSREGFIVPKVIGLYLPGIEESEMFIVLEKMEINDPNKLTPYSAITDAFKSYPRILDKAIDLDYRPDDITSNWGVNDEGKVVIYDFELWKGPPELEKRINDFF